VRQGPDVSDFEYESAESDERGLVWFRRQFSGLWRVGSIHQNWIIMDEFSWHEVTSAIHGYVPRVDHWVESQLKVGVADFFHI
jgi:hypothetical protein